MPTNNQPRRIDSRVHFWQLACGDYSWLTPQLAPIHRDFGRDELAPLIAASDIDAIILVQAAPSEGVRPLDDFGDHPATGETRLYRNLLLRKGVIRPD
jgi:hypothetical protein